MIWVDDFEFDDNRFSSNQKKWAFSIEAFDGKPKYGSVRALRVAGGLLQPEGHTFSLAEAFKFDCGTHFDKVRLSPIPEDYGLLQPS